MKIAFVSMLGDIVVPPYLDAQGICIYQLARRLVKYCDVIVYAIDHPFNKKAEIGEGVDYRYIKSAPDNLLRKLISKFSRFHIVKQPLVTSRWHCIMYALQVAKDLRSERCDIAHINTFPQFIHVIRVFNPKIKIVLHNHTEFLVQLNREITERQLRKADLIIGCSEYITEKIRGAFPLFSKRCQTLYNGVDVNHFFSIKSRDTEKNSVKRLLFVGRISPEKGLHVLFDAFKKVVERFPKAHLTIVGPNSPLSLEGLKFMVNDQKIFKSLAAFYDGISRCNYFSYLQRRLFSLEISKNVTFTGLVPHLQLVNFYRNADVFVNSSFSEAFGMPLIEAMATKVPVVAPLVGGIKEIVENGKTGIIVEPCDDNSLAEAILSLLSDKNLRESMGEAARRRAVEIFSWERIVERLLRLYKNTCVGDFSD